MFCLRDKENAELPPNTDGLVADISYSIVGQEQPVLGYMAVDQAALAGLNKAVDWCTTPPVAF
jgi:hypothetical protein